MGLDRNINCVPRNDLIFHTNMNAEKNSVALVIQDAT